MTYYLITLLFVFAVTCGAQNEQNITNTRNESSLKIDDVSLIPPDAFFLNKIFNKYGDENIITFEGFEHLLDNLGLGGGVFSSPHELALHRINGTFQSIHDPAHRHKRHAQKVSEAEEKRCLSPKDIIEIYHLEIQPGIIAIHPSTFLNVCPALVYQLDQKSCYHHKPLEKETKDKYLNWIYAGFAVFVISAIGLLGVALMPLASSSIFQEILHFLVALAIGTLCGDAMLHLLPHALTNHEVTVMHNENHNDPILKCGVVLLTILLFYSLEGIMRICTGNSSKHQHSHNQPKRRSILKTEAEGVELQNMLSKEPKIKKESMSPVALMVILGDGLHNITDGLAIGAAFSTDPVTGFATALAVFCHELPHELGDFAVLIRAGFSIKKAIYYNVLSSVLSFLGVVLGLWVAEDHVTSSQWIYAATAGTFLYISLADLVPEITANGSGKFGDFCLSFLGIVSGGVIMLSIALFEDKLKYLFDS